MSSRSQEAIRGLIAHGYGFAVQNAIPATAIISDGNRIAVLALDDELPTTTTVSLRLKRYTARPAVWTFEAYMHEAFAPGSITAPRVDP